MYQCFNCGEYAVYWNGDFDYEDYGLDGEGIVHECTCRNCGALITYYCPIDMEGENDTDK